MTTSDMVRELCEKMNISMESKVLLLNFINDFGIIACNKDNFIKSINDIGSSWQDAVALINEREIFYSKIYKKKTVYLSKYLYCLLKKTRECKKISENASTIYKILKSNPPQNTEMLKIVSCLNKDFLYYMA